jgi:hypothetical protein
MKKDLPVVDGVSCRERHKNKAMAGERTDERKDWKSNGDGMGRVDGI